MDAAWRVLTSRLGLLGTREHQVTGSTYAVTERTDCATSIGGLAETLERFSAPELALHGDTHRFRHDQP